MDPVQVAKKQEEQDRLPFIVPEEFWTEYEPQADGSMKSVEWVRWIKKGMQTPATCVEKISRISKPNKSGQIVPEWIVLKPYYDNWKAGQAAPVNGTPLEAWPGATPSLVKALNTVNIRSVEDFAEMEDASIQRISIPGLRGKQTQAKSYLEALKSTAGVSAEIVKLRDENEFLRNELNEIKALIGRQEQAIQEPASEIPEPVRKRGRPRKHPIESQTAA